jgi:hypothetical protein
MPIVRFRRVVAVALAAAPLLLSVTQPSSAAAPELNHRSVMAVRGQAHAGVGQARVGTRSGSNGINYNGGAVMTGATKAYVIWYGNWTTTKQSIIGDFLKTVGGSPYYNINTTYTNAAGAKVQNSVTWGGETTDAYSQGKTNLSDAQIQSVASAAITGGKLPADPNGIYFVLTSSDVTKSGFLTSYCGWHTYATIAGTNIKFSFVGDPTGPSIGSCAGQSASSPNGDVGADAMVSVIAHELEEAVTDPNLNAWYDSRGYENADKCAWTFGTTYAAANGSLANMKLGTRDFLVQRNWVNASGGLCALKW